MKVLVIGGNRFVGIDLTLRLLARGIKVTLLNRGTLSDPFGSRVHRLQADRGTDAFDQALDGTRWDAVIDLALFDGPQTDRLARVLGGKTSHVITLSTGQVYLVRTPRPVIATESDFDGPVMDSAPAGELDDWKYGIEKRDMEMRLAASGLPFTVFRIPMVHGARDQKNRLGRLFWKVLDGQPIRLRAASAPVRQIFSGAVVDMLLAALERGPSQRAWNLAWNEPLTTTDLVHHVGRVLGVTPTIIEDPQATTDDCFLNSRWMSALDASAAHRELGFVHPPLETWLPQFAHGWSARL